MGQSYIRRRRSNTRMESPSQTKMTRAMVQKVISQGKSLPWIVNPAEPVKVTDPEVAYLADGELQAEEEGELDSTWNPDMDISNIDENDIVRTETTSDVRTTRATNPMTDRNLEDIEQQFVPFDVTPDMYDVNPCENEDYGKFLKGVYGDRNNSYIEEEDEEYVYNPEEDLDPEEFREDKDADVGKEELADLLDDLKVFANNKMREMIKKNKVLDTIQDVEDEEEEISEKCKENVEV